MPLEAFVAEVMKLLAQQPDAREIRVSRMLPLRNAAEGGQEKYAGCFQHFNDAMKAARPNG